MPIHVVTDVVIDVENLCLIGAKRVSINVLEGQRVITIVKEVLLLLFVWDKLEPNIVPIIDSWIVPWPKHRNDILRERIVVSQCRVNSVIFKLTCYHFGDVLHNSCI